MTVLWKQSCARAAEVFSHEGHYGNGKGLLSSTCLCALHDLWVALDPTGEGPGLMGAGRWLNFRTLTARGHIVCPPPPPPLPLRLPNFIL